jgi:hypothetical protein
VTLILYHPIIEQIMVQKYISFLLLAIWRWNSDRGNSNSRTTFSNILIVMTTVWMIHKIIYECFKSVVLLKIIIIYVKIYLVICTTISVISVCMKIGTLDSFMSRKDNIQQAFKLKVTVNVHDVKTWFIESIKAKSEVLNNKS